MVTMAHNVVRLTKTISDAKICKSLTPVRAVKEVRQRTLCIHQQIYRPSDFGSPSSRKARTMSRYSYWRQVAMLAAVILGSLVCLVMASSPATAAPAFNSPTPLKLADSTLVQGVVAPQASIIAGHHYAKITLHNELSTQAVLFHITVRDREYGLSYATLSLEAGDCKVIRLTKLDGGTRIFVRAAHRVLANNYVVGSHA